MHGLVHGLLVSLGSSAGSDNNSASSLPAFLFACVWKQILCLENSLNMVKIDVSCNFKMQWKDLI